jgi:hypothetical protein
MGVNLSGIGHNRCRVTFSAVDCLESSSSRTLAGFHAVLYTTRYFIPQVINGLSHGHLNQVEQDKGALLNPFIGLFHAEFPAPGIPRSDIDISMDAMDQYRHKQLAVYFTVQAIFLAGIGLVYAQNRLDLERGLAISGGNHPSGAFVPTSVQSAICR